MNVAAFVLVLALSAPPPGALADPASPDPAVRAQATRELARQATPQALAWLAYLLRSDASPAVRAAAAGAIADTGIPHYEVVLEVAARSDPDQSVRRAASAAHERLWPMGKSPRLAGGLSLLCPGCGHFYLRRPGKGLGFLLGTAALLGTGIGLLGSAPGGLDGGFEDARGPIGLSLAIAGQNLWFYGIFSAYRDARLMRGNAGYRTSVSDESLGYLATAPFRPSVLARPRFWVALPLLFGGALGLSALADGGWRTGGRPTLFESRDVNFLGRRFSAPAGFALGEAYYGSLFLPVAVGEEALFRGVIQPGLREMLGDWGGWALASLIFGGVHIGNFLQGGDVGLEDAAWAVPYITAGGAYMGYVSMRENGRLATSVALHFWYDFLLGTTAFLLDPENQPFVVRVGSSF
jgi:membrane protease YdiL (CAAX protease family)